MYWFSRKKTILFSSSLFVFFFSVQSCDWFLKYLCFHAHPCRAIYYVAQSFYTCQPFYIYRRDIFYLKSAKIFRRGPIISEDVRRLSEDFQSCYGEFCLTRTQEHKGTLTSLLKKENSEKVDHPHRLFFSLFGSVLFK